MYLKRLELIGFKSFADKRKIDFDPGFTAIVGPNGSGKSNVVDAIRWVLGEQSLKTLRGKKSEDVIFSGSKIRSRQSLAEVTITFDNSDGQFPIDFREVEITRRVFRNGDSEYLLNRSKVRLMDVQDLLAKFGFAQRTYSIISQGMIESILMSGQQERKELFEEASGIKQFQIKRDRALTKLEATKENLHRAKDLIKEIEPRLKMLKRQAQRAARREEVASELNFLSRRYYNWKWNAVSRKLKIVEKTSASLHEREEHLSKSIKRLDSNLIMREESLFKQDDLQSASQKLQKLFAERNQIAGQLAVAEGRLQIESERDSSTQEIEAKSKAENLKHELENIEEKNSKLDKGISQKKSAAENNLQKLTDWQKRLTDWQNKITALLPQTGQNNRTLKNELESNLQELTASLSQLIARLKNLNDLSQVAETRQRAEEYQEKFSLFTAQIQQLINNENQKDLAVEQREITELADKREQLLQETQKMNIEIARLEAEKSIWQERKEVQNQELETLEKSLQTASQNKTSTMSAKLVSEKEELEKKLAGCEQNIKEAQNRQADLSEEQKKQQIQTRDIEKMLRSHREQATKLKDEILTFDIEKTRLQTKKEGLKMEIREGFSESELEKLLNSFRDQPVDLPKSERGQAKEQIKKLRKNLAAIGDIDEGVLAEFSEVEKRHQFLTTQHDDLKQAAHSLLRVIKELDQTISRQFENALHKINQGFQKYFEILFGGGSAKLFKLRPMREKNEDGNEEISEAEKDKLAHEYYIDIKATPPGKRLKNLTMLSGGERALTSVALVFAIIAANPTPFIVLDEVDAALDEANSQRFGKILEAVSRKTQFISITHNRETMKKAGILYGVTMGEDGVSKMLSVKLEEVAKDKVLKD